MDRLKQAKRIVAESIEFAKLGIFNTRSVTDTEIDTIYIGDGLKVCINFPYEYFEVFGLSDEEFKELENFYNSLR